MKTLSTILAAGLALQIGYVSAPALAAPKGAAAAPPKKATAAKAPAGGGPVVLGTNQLPGDFGKLGQTYTIGTSEPLNFTLKSAAYSIAPVSIGQNTWVPKADEKLLVLHYTVHNPLSREQTYSASSLRFTAVDTQDTNHDSLPCVAREGERDPLVIALKPAQKLDVTTAILVPGTGVVPKLIVEREQGVPVIRYDLRGKVAPLPAAVAADPEGATALPEIPAQAGTFYAMGVFDVRLDSVGEVNGPLLRRAPEAGKRYVTATFTFRNRSNRSERYYWPDFRAELRDSDGEKAPDMQALVKATRDEADSGDLLPGEETRIRFFFPLPIGVAARTLKLGEGKRVDARTARVFAFDLAAAPTN